MGLGDAAERDPVGGHLQRPDHHRAHPARPARRRVPGRRRPACCCGATSSSTASAGSSPRSSGSRRSTSSSPPSTSHRTEHDHLPPSPALAGVALLLAMTVITGVGLPGRRHRHRPGRLPAPGERIDDRRRRQDGRLEPHRPGASPTQYFWGRPSAAGKDGYDASGSGGLQPRADEPGADRPDHRRGRRRAGGQRRRARSRSTS